MNRDGNRFNDVYFESNNPDYIPANPERTQRLMYDGGLDSRASIARTVADASNRANITPKYDAATKTLTVDYHRHSVDWRLLKEMLAEIAKDEGEIQCLVLLVSQDTFGEQYAEFINRGYDRCLALESQASSQFAMKRKFQSRAHKERNDGE